MTCKQASLLDGSAEQAHYDSIRNSGLETSEMWYTIYLKDKVDILDPDGWDRSNYIYSWEEELITWKEFLKRLSMSTIYSKVPTTELMGIFK